MKVLKFFTCCFALVMFAPVANALHYEDFFGNYEGKYTSPSGDSKHDRDLSVKIKEVKDGFNLTWVTTTFKKDKPKDKKYSIDFLKTDRDHIYQAAQKKNLFGGREPLDPMKGEPFAWARLEDHTLSVFVLVITDSGGYEMQTFDRVMTDDGNLEVRFSRFRNGEKLKTIKATLLRQ